MKGYRKFLIQLGSTKDGWKSSMILNRVISNKMTLLILKGFAAGVAGSSRTTEQSYLTINTHKRQRCSINLAMKEKSGSNM